MEDKNKTFSYTYSAKQQEEIKNIRQKYLPKEEDSIERLRKLDAGVTKPGTVTAFIVGIIGTLIFGIGMCCCMVCSDTCFISGIVIGICGIVILSAAYPLYEYITKKKREKLAPEIMRLTDELMK